MEASFTSVLGILGKNMLLNIEMIFNKISHRKNIFVFWPMVDLQWMFSELSYKVSSFFLLTIRDHTFYCIFYFFIFTGPPTKDSKFVTGAIFLSLPIEIGPEEILLTTCLETQVSEKNYQLHASSCFSAWDMLLLGSIRQLAVDILHIIWLRALSIYSES